VTAKRTGPRFVFDNNQPVFTGSTTAPTEVFSSKVDAYWLVNLDARFNLGYLDQKLSKTFVQLNVYNLFDSLYAGGFSGGLNQALNSAGTFYGNPPFIQIGAPRTVSMTVNVGF